MRLIGKFNCNEANIGFANKSVRFLCVNPIQVSQTQFLRNFWSNKTIIIEIKIRKINKNDQS